MAQPFDAETAGNAEEIEQQFAVKTVEHLEVSLGSLLHLNRCGAAEAGGPQIEGGALLDRR